MGELDKTQSEQSDDEWLDMRDDYPKDWQRAIALEAEVKKEKPNVYFHNSLKVLSEVRFKGGGM